MADHDKSKEELIQELEEMRQKYDSLKKLYNRDISGQNKTDKPLMVDGNERFRHAFEYSAVGIWFVDTNGKFILGNNAIQELTGYTNAELNNLTFNDITHPDDVSIGLGYLKRHGHCRCGGIYLLIYPVHWQIIFSDFVL